MENKFVDGLFVSLRENSPAFVKANLSFQTDKFIEYLKANCNAKGYCNIDILMSKERKLYAKLNDWKPKETTNEEREITLKDFEGEEIRIDSIPF